MHDDLSDWRHGHSFGQEVRRSGEGRTLLVIAITAAMTVAEIVAGLAFASMALLADGLHMASHTAALGIAAFAYVYARRHASDPRYTFGTGKVNALGGFTGAVLLAAFAVFMAAGSIDRLIHPVTIAFDYAIAVAVAGLVVNGVCAVILSGGQDAHGHAGPGEHADHAHDHRAHDDHNLRSAYLHVLADALTSVLAIVGAVLVARWSIGLMRASSAVLLDRRGPRGCGRRSSRASRPTATAGSRTSTCGPSGPASTPPR